MRNKKIIFPLLGIVLIVIVIILISLFSHASTTTAIVTVLEKNYSKNKKEALITAGPPNASKEYQKGIKILVKEPMVWNLIEEDKTYLVNYINKQNDVRVLTHIQNVGDHNALQ